MTVKSYKDLVVWQKAMELVIAVYDLTNKFPKTEQYELSKQMRSCATSIPSNIAEGSRRSTKKDYRHFLCIAFGSGAELETQIEIAKRLSFVTAKDSQNADGLLDEVMRMLNVMIANLHE